MQYMMFLRSGGTMPVAPGVAFQIGKYKMHPPRAMSQGKHLNGGRPHQVIVVVIVACAK